MTSRRTVVGGLVLLFTLAGAAFAAEKGKEVTVTGNLECAKCTLKAADATKCQDVLVVEGTGGAPATEYYLVKNAVAVKFGQGSPAAQAGPSTCTKSEALKVLGIGDVLFQADDPHQVGPPAV